MDKDKLLNWITVKLQELKTMEKRERRFDSIQGAAECVGARSALMELRSQVTVGNFDPVVDSCQFPDGSCKVRGPHTGDKCESIREDYLMGAIREL